jgi:hypothetical protein
VGPIRNLFLDKIMYEISLVGQNSFRIHATNTADRYNDRLEIVFNTISEEKP